MQVLALVIKRYFVVCVCVCVAFGITNQTQSVWICRRVEELRALANLEAKQDAKQDTKQDDKTQGVGDEGRVGGDCGGGGSGGGASGGRHSGIIAVHMDLGANTEITYSYR